MLEEEDQFGNEELEEDAHDDQPRAVASSMVSEWGYEREAGQIHVIFRNGHSQSYSCEPEVWAEAKQAVSPGRFIHEHFL